VITSIDVTDPVFATSCPRCFPGDHLAVTPITVDRDPDAPGSLKAHYRHGVCGAEFDCWFDAEAAGWPLRREEAA
jgi:hypothetical protein